MFAPEGFISLRQLMDSAIFHPALFDQAVNSVTRMGGEHTPEHDGFFDAIENAVFSFANHFGLWACAIDGRSQQKIPVSLPPQSLVGEHTIQTLDVLRDEKTEELFEQAFQAFGWQPIVSHRALIQQDMMRGNAGNRQRLNDFPTDMWRYKTGSPYHERGAYTVDTSLARFLAHYGRFDTDCMLLPAMRQLEGFTLCMRHDDEFGKSWAEFSGPSLLGEPEFLKPSDQMIDELANETESQIHEANRANLSNAKDEADAAKLGRKMLSEDERKTLLKKDLIKAFDAQGIRLGRNAERRVISDLRESYPYISKGGRPPEAGE